MEDPEANDRNTLSSCPTPLRVAILEMLGEYTPPTPKAAPEPEVECPPCPPIGRLRYRA
jgi:hypothetical protein